MIKKILAITLSIAMLMSVPAFAGTISEPDPVTGKVTYSENFDALRESTAMTKLVSNVIPQNKTGSYVNVKILNETGPDKSKALVLNSSADVRVFSTVDLGIVETMTHAVKYSYDFQINSIPYTAKSWKMYLGGAAQISDGKSTTYTYPLFQVQNTGRLYYYPKSSSSSTMTDSQKDLVNGTWYTVEVYVTADGFYGWLYEKETKNLVGYNMRNAYAGKTDYTAAAILKSDTYAVSGGGYVIDNVYAEKYTPELVAPTVATAPAIAGQTIEVDTASTTVTFDQLLDTTSTATLKLRGDDEGEDCAITMDTSAPYKYTIALPELEGGTEYTLDLSTLTNTGGAAVAGTTSYDFSTKAEPIVVSSSTPANGADGVGIKTKSMSVTFSDTPVNPPQTVAVTSGTTPIEAAVSTEDNLTYTLDWSLYTEDLLGLTEYTVDLSGFSNAAGTVNPASISFTTAYDGIERITDDFEKSDAYKSSVYNQISSKTGNPSFTDIPLTNGLGNSGGISQVDGYNGKALQLSSVGASSFYIDPLYTHSTFIPEPKVIDDKTVYEQFVVTYRFNIVQVADYSDELVKWKTGDTEASYKTTGFNISMGADKGANTTISNASKIAVITSDSAGKAHIHKYGAGKGDSIVELTPQKWYNAVLTLDGNKEKYYLIDSETGEIVWSNSMTVANITPGQAVRFMPLSFGRGKNDTQKTITNNNGKLLIDDFAIWRIKPWKASQTLKEDAAKVVDTGSAFGGGCEFTFDQPVILDKTMFEINDGAVESNPTFTYPDFTKATVKFTDLAVNGNYTVDYSEIKSAGGTDLGDAKNTAVFDIVTGAYSDEITASAITVTSYDADGVVNATLTSKSAVNADVVAVFYNSANPDEISAIRLAKKSLVKGANNVEINLNSAVSANSVKLYVLVLNKLIPLMK